MSRCQILNSFVFRHAIPPPFAIPVAQYIIRLCECIQCDVQPYDAEQSAVTALVLWCIILAVDVRSNNPTPEEVRC